MKWLFGPDALAVTVRRVLFVVTGALAEHVAEPLGAVLLLVNKLFG